MDILIMALDPVIVKLGAFALRWYGLMIALGIASGIFIALREARRLGINEDTTYTCALWSVVGGVIGARLFHVLDRIDFYLQNPAYVLAIQPGELAFWGAIFGGVAAGALYCRQRRLPMAAMLDLAAPAILVGQMVGRLGSLVNGDAFGPITDLPWALMYIHPDAMIPDLGEPTQPYPLYETIWNIALLGWLWRRRLEPSRPGRLFLQFLIYHAIGRFILTFARADVEWVFSLRAAQIIAIIVLAIAVPLYLRRFRAAGGPPPVTLESGV